MSNYAGDEQLEEGIFHSMFPAAGMHISYGLYSRWTMSWDETAVIYNLLALTVSA